MKKSKLRVIVFTIIALSVVLGNSGLAEAEDMKITGQIRHRTERNDKDFSDETASYGFSFLRSRMNLKFTNEKTYAFIQIQDSRVFGTETNTLSDGSADALDFHQAYFALSDFVTKGLTVMVGRREIAYANQRLMASTAEELNRQTDQLNELVGKFKLESDSSNVAAAVEKVTHHSTVDSEKE